MRKLAWWKKALLALGALVVLAGGFMVYQIGPSNIIGMLRYDQRREGDLQVGDTAPDVAAYTVDGAGKTSILTAAPGQPLVLVFGSFT
jgi:hypothetical protein